MEHHVWHTVFGLAGLLAVAVVMVPAARRFNFPYTVLLAVLGCVIGVAELSFGELHGLGIFGDFFGALSGFKISSEAIFFVFLPALIFESALSIDVRRLFDDIGSILLLAVIGLLISTIVVGYSLWAVSGLRWLLVYSSARLCPRPIRWPLWPSSRISAHQSDWPF